MFETLKYCYSVYKLVSYINYIESLDDDINVNKLQEALITIKSYINDLGFVGIKFTQWYITRLMSVNNEKNNIIINYFNNLFENCDEHPLEFTKKTFYNSIGIELEEYIDIKTLKCMASGSVGQVYYAKIKDTPVEVAIKVKHPNVSNDLDRLNNFIYVLNMIKNLSFYKHKYKLYFDYEDFKEYLVKQVDFRNEVENCKKFQEEYKDNDYILFPKVYQYSEDIIISKYENGISFHELSDYQKTKCAINFLSFVLDSLLIKNFMHGDLHIKNWKLQEMRNGIDYKLVVYDHGICFSTQGTDYNRLFWDAFETNNKQQIIHFFEMNAQPYLSDKLKAKINDLYDEFCEKKQTVFMLCKNIFDCFQLQDEIKLNKNILNFMIFINLVEDIIMKEICIGNANIDYNMIASVCNVHTSIIAYCNSKKVYPELKKYMESKIAERNKNGIIASNDLFVNSNNLTFDPIPIE